MIPTTMSAYVGVRESEGESESENEGESESESEGESVRDTYLDEGVKELSPWTIVHNED